MSEDINYINTVQGPEKLNTLEAHAINALRVNPGNVEANDKLVLVREVKRLRALLQAHEASPMSDATMLDLLVQWFDAQKPDDQCREVQLDLQRIANRLRTLDGR